MPDIWMDVDTAVQVPVSLMPLVDRTDFITIEDAIAYNESGMAVAWNFVTTAGLMTTTAITPTTGDDHDWLEEGADQGMYSIEIPASAGDANNDTEGFGWITGETSSCLPFRGPTIGFRAAALNNALIDGGDTLDVNITSTADIDLSDTQKASVNTEANNALVALKLDHLIAVADSDDVVNNSIIAKMVSKAGTADWSGFVNTTDSLEAIRDRGDAEWITATGFSTHNAAAVWAVATRVLTANTNLNDPSAAVIAGAVWDEDATGHQNAGTFGQAIGDPGANAETMYDAVITDAAGTNVAADIIVIESQTDDIGVAGAGLTDLGSMSDGMKAEVESEVNDGLIALGLDHLVSAAVAGADVADDSIIASLVSKEVTADWDDFVNTTDSLQAIRDRGDAEWVTATGFSTHAAAAIWAVDATGQQSQGTFGQAIGDPGADADTIYGSVVSGAAGANIAVDIIAIKGETASILDDTDLIDDGTSGLAKIASDVAAVLVDTGTTIPLTLNGLVLAQGTVGDTGNDTTHIHLEGLAFGDDEPNEHLIVLKDVSTGLYYSTWISDFATATDLATVNTLPVTPENDVDLYWLLPMRQDVTGGSGPSSADIADAVWNEAAAGHTDAGKAGQQLWTDIDAILEDTNELQGDTHTAAEVWSSGTRTLTANTNLNDPSAATIADAILDEPLEDHDTQGNVGWAMALAVYAGSDGPGIYVDSGAANENTVVGTDGTEINPVSTFAAARNLANALGLKIYYLEGNSDATLAATHVDWEFIGIGSVSDNIVNLGTQDVSRSLFRNLTVEGTQGGAGRITARDCALQDPGAGDTTLHIFAERCGFVDRIQVDASADNVFDQCFSLVAGTGAPVIEATGAAGTIAIRHYSGGLEFESLSASHNVTWEGIGQVIFNADCNVNANVSVRGVGAITDNTAGMSSLTETSLVNMTKINAEVDTAIETYGLDHLVSASVTGTDVADNSIIAKMVDDAATADWNGYDPTTASLEALNVDTDAIKAETALIVADTNEIQGKLPTNKFMGSSDGADDDGTLNTISTNVTNIQGRIPAALVSSRMDSTIDATGMESGAVSNIHTTQLTESYAANGVAPTSAQLWFAVHQMLMQFGISGTSITVRELDDNATAFVVTLDDATNPTDAKRV